MEWVAGCDAGGKGALVFMNRQREFQVFRFSKYEYREVFYATRYFNVVRSFMERSNERPGEANQFAWGRNYGKAELLMDILPWPTEMVESKAWQYHHNMGGRMGPNGCDHEGGSPWRCCDGCAYRAKKKACNELAKTLYIGQHVTLEDSDARLICDFAWNLTWGNKNENKPLIRPGTGLVRTVTRVRD